MEVVNMANVTSIRIADDLVDALESKAKELDRSKGWVMNEALREFFAREKLKQKRWKETDEALLAIESGDEYDENEVNEWLDSWGREKELYRPERP